MTRPAVHLAAGASIAGLAMLLTHPLAVAGALGLALAYAHAAGVRERTRWVHRAALGIGLAVVAFNALFSWNGATLLWQAPFRIDVLGRPRLTLEAILWGSAAGAQLAATVLALGTATLTVPPEALHHALARIGLPNALATAAGLALRLVPDTTRDARAMRDALGTRGVRTDGLRGTSQVLVPLTARTLDRAMVAEEALLLRGYDNTSRGASSARIPTSAWIALAGLALAATVAFLGPGRPPYYPTVQIPMHGMQLALIAATLLPSAWLVVEVARS